MSTMVSTVLQIEREAEAQLENARAEADTILADAKIRRERDAQAAADAIRREIADLEKDAAADRAKEGRERQRRGAGGSGKSAEYCRRRLRQGRAVDF